MSAVDDAGPYYCPTCERHYTSGASCPEDGTRLVRIAPPEDPLIGRELDGRYTIREKLGEGGMGAVYRASQHSVGRDVAIKVINAHLVSQADIIKRFLREAKLASRLSHPNAVAVLDFNQTSDGLLYLVMELVSGRTLDRVIETERVLPAERVVRIGTQICDALEGAHTLSIVHRDLKPANIMVLDSSSRDLVKVLDFGLAKGVGQDHATTMTNAGALLGTPAFMPPELAQGDRCDGRADLYSLGVILYLLGSGRLPFVSNSVHELIAMHASEPPPPMTGVPPALAKVIDRLLRKDPAQRYQTAAELRDALEAALRDHYLTPLPVRRDAVAWDDTALQQASMASSIVPVTRASADTPPPVTARRRRWLLPFVGGIIVAAAGAVSFLALSTDDEPARTAPAPVATPPPAPPPTASAASEDSPTPPTEPEPVPVVAPAEPPPEASAGTAAKSALKPTSKRQRTPRRQRVEKPEPSQPAAGSSEKKSHLPF